MEAEEQLWTRISVEIENKRQKNKQLKQEVEQRRRKCEDLTKILNKCNISQL
jgi:FtsZ-binding cell division protein ZapB